MAVWGAGPIGQMTATFAFMNGAKRVILIDHNWRLDFVKSKLPQIETVNFSQLGEGGVPQTLKEMTNGLGPDCCLECVAGEYPKSKKHAAELAAGLENDTPEILNEMIESVQSFGRIGITGIYVGMTNGFNIGSVSLAPQRRARFRVEELPTIILLVPDHGARYQLQGQWPGSRPNVLE